MSSELLRRSKNILEQMESAKKIPRLYSYQLQKFIKIFWEFARASSYTNYNFIIKIALAKMGIQNYSNYASLFVFNYLIKYQFAEYEIFSLTHKQNRSRHCLVKLKYKDETIFVNPIDNEIYITFELKDFVITNIKDHYYVHIDKDLFNINSFIDSTIEKTLDRIEIQKRIDIYHTEYLFFESQKLSLSSNSPSINPNDVTTLNFNGLNVKGRLGSFLSYLYHSNIKLKEIDLSRTSIDGDDIFALLNFISHPFKTEIEVINLSHNPDIFTSSVATSFFTTREFYILGFYHKLNRCKSLQYLILDGISFTIEQSDELINWINSRECIIDVYANLPKSKKLLLESAIIAARDRNELSQKYTETNNSFSPQIILYPEHYEGVRDLLTSQSSLKDTKENFRLISLEILSAFYPSETRLNCIKKILGGSSSYEIYGFAALQFNIYHIYNKLKYLIESESRAVSDLDTGSAYVEIYQTVKHALRAYENYGDLDELLNNWFDLSISTEINNQLIGPQIKIDNVSKKVFQILYSGFIHTAEELHHYAISSNTFVSHAQLNTTENIFNAGKEVLKTGAMFIPPAGKALGIMGKSEVGQLSVHGYEFVMAGKELITKSTSTSHHRIQSSKNIFESSISYLYGKEWIRSSKKLENVRMSFCGDFSVKIRRLAELIHFTYGNHIYNLTQESIYELGIVCMKQINKLLGLGLLRNPSATFPAHYTVDKFTEMALQFLMYFPLDKYDTELHLKSGGTIRLDNLLQHNHIRYLTNGQEFLIAPEEVRFVIDEKYVRYFSDKVKIEACSGIPGIRWASKAEIIPLRKFVNGDYSARRQVVGNSKLDPLGTVKWDLTGRSCFFREKGERSTLIVTTRHYTNYATSIDDKFYKHTPPEQKNSNLGRLPIPSNFIKLSSTNNLKLKTRTRRLGIFAKSSEEMSNSHLSRIHLIEHVSRRSSI